MNCGEIARKLVERTPELVAVVYEDRRLTAADLLERSIRLVNALRDRGIEPGDRVATLGVNALRSVEEIVALALGGYVRVPLHQGNSPERHQHMIRHSGARALILDEVCRNELGDDAASIGLPCVLVDDGVGSDYERALAAASPVDPRVPILPGDACQLGYTGGTTGLPKGAIQSQRSWLDVTVENLLLMGTGDADAEPGVYLAAGPMTGFAGSYVFSALAAGMTIAVSPDRTAATAARLAREHDATVMVALTPLIEELAESPDVHPEDFRALRRIISAGAPLRSRAIRAFSARFGPILAFAYGQSECLPISVLTPDLLRRGLADEPELLQSAGRATLRSRIVVLGSDGQERPRGEIGEIAADAAGSLIAYWADPAATAAKFTADGLVRTGDLGLLRDDGILFLADRSEDVLRVAGEQVYPSAVEDALSDHPDVLEVVVIGKADPALGEIPHAVVALRGNVAVDAALLTAWWAAESRLSRLPLQIEISGDPLPRTPAGKLSRALVRALVARSSA